MWVNFAMLELEITGLDRVRAKVRGAQQALPIATAKALTFTAERAQNKATKMIPQVFNQPTPFTRRAVRKTSATPRRLYSEVLIKDLSATRQHYLLPQIRGGKRPQGRAEKRLGGYWVPGREARRNRYGNLTKGTWSKILADLQLFGLRTGDAANTLTRRQGGKKRILYFMRRHSNGKRVIYKKLGKKRIVPWLIEVSEPRYHVRFPFPKVVSVTMRAEYPAIFDRVLTREVERFARAA